MCVGGGGGGGGGGEGGGAENDWGGETLKNTFYKVFSPEPLFMENTLCFRQEKLILPNLM